MTRHLVSKAYISVRADQRGQEVVMDNENVYVMYAKPTDENRIAKTF